MVAFYWFLAIYLVPIIALGEVSVISQNAKVRDRMDTNVVNREPFLLTTKKNIENRRIGKKYSNNDTGYDRKEIASKKQEKRRSKFKLAKNGLDEREILLKENGSKGAHEINGNTGQLEFKNERGKLISTIFKRSINRRHRDLHNRYENETSMESVYRGHRNWHTARKKHPSRLHVKKRRRKDAFLKTIGYDNKEMDHPPVKKERTSESEVTSSGLEIPMEHITKDSHSRDHNVQESEKRMPHSTLRDSDSHNFTDIPWPLVPGPITCELDYQLQPSFVAKLGEFDYVVSVERQDNPGEPPEHICTGVIYNRRFVIITPHCLKDNYGLSVTSTDDLCTIDEMIDVDYIIEHKNYDPETRKNDIALIKLKSEIHKRHANFANEDEALGTYFYAVGFGELMWKSFPTKVSKLLQKVPVVRYTKAQKEVPGTLHVTTSHMDLTGSFRGDYGGALVNPRGEFVGLKSKFVKRSTEYEVYTRVRDYLPWIKSMVALHGS